MTVSNSKDNSPVSLRGVLTKLSLYWDDYTTGENKLTVDQAEVAIHAYIERLVETAKPERWVFEDGQNDATHFYNKGINEYEQAIKTVLKGENGNEAHN